MYEFASVLMYLHSDLCSKCTVCVCVFFPFILDIKFVGRTSRGHTGGRSQDYNVGFLPDIIVC